MFRHFPFPFAARPAAALAGLLIVAGCVGTHRPGQPETVPLAPDPGPASARPLSPRFEILARDAGNQGFVRALLELRRQVDIPALMASQQERCLSRGQGREETLRALAQVAEESQALVEPLLEELLARGLLDYYEKLRFRNRIFISIRPEALEKVRMHPQVAEVIPEYDGVREARRAAGMGLIGKAPPIPPGDSWGVEMLGLRRLWEDGIDGRGVVIGILDSGVMGTHEALADAHREDDYWYDPVGGSPAALDTVPHGSQVLSCALGRPTLGHALGTAPGARWVAALSNYHNSYNNVNMSLAADWLIFEGRPDVMLGAWGHGKAACDPRDRPMVQALRAAGIVPVFAAGNDGPDPATGQTPAALTGLFPFGLGPLSVAAIDRHGKIIGPSSRGPNPCSPEVPFPDVTAPGWEVPVPTGGGPRSLTLASGTSMSVGWVGGLAAMILQVAPEMPVWEVERIIRETARDLPPEGFDAASGHGLIDPAAAVAAARRWRPACR
ncbi:MAG: S8 family serine peptidase [Acidobacteriota bacterium]|nr:S8 family serine peptidase [Acidobacteriota bacterium]